MLRVLRARGLDVPQAIEQRIRECTDLAQLQDMVTRAVTANSAGELFDE